MALSLKSHSFKPHLTFYGFQGRRVIRLSDLRFLRRDPADFPPGSKSRGNVIAEPAQDFHGPDHVVGVFRKSPQIPQAHLPSHHQEASCHYHSQKQAFPKERDHRLMICQNPGLSHIQFVEFPVVAAKFFYLIRLFGKCFHRAHSGQILLGHGVQGRCLLADLVVNLPQSFLHPHGADADQWKKNQRHQRQQGIQPHHKNQNHDGLHCGFHCQDPQKSSHRPYLVDIVFNSGHDLACIVTVKEVYRHSLKLLKEILSHVTAHRDAYIVIGKFLHVLKYSPSKADPQKSQHQRKEQAGLPFPYDLVNDPPGNLRSHHVQSYTDCHSCESQQIQIPIALHIIQKRLHFTLPSL